MGTKITLVDGSKSNWLAKSLKRKQNIITIFVAIGRTMLLILASIAGIVLATTLAVILVSKPSADLPSLTATTRENDPRILIERTKGLPEVTQFLNFYPNATAKIDSTYVVDDKQRGILYSFEKKYHDRNFSQTARLYIVLNDMSNLNSGRSYLVRMNCLGISYIDIEKDIDSHGVISAVDYSNVTMFVTETGCAR